MTNKLLGQNWLINPRLHEIIVSAAEVTPKDTMVEVGPGTGLLTRHLAQTGATVLAIEKDAHLAHDLQKQFKNTKNVTIIPGDILKFDPSSRLPVSSYKLVGNIPYYLTSHLLRITLEKWPRPKCLVLMIQKEVAQRVVAKPPHMSLLALSVQFYGQAQIIQYVGKENFHPTPKVDSAIIKIVPHDLSDTDRRLAPTLFKIAHAAFSGKRKQLLNSLSTGFQLSKAEVGTVLDKAGVDKQRRPETLDLQEWLNLSLLLSFLSPAD